ncbi:MAG: glycosyltransferase [Actinobacteria bacterium]|nr:glycosyltransferase [Actinomycetota bacterium]
MIADTGADSTTIGIGILTYNREGYLKTLIEALLTQETEESFPVVILDNGSLKPLDSSIRRLLDGLAGPVTVLRESGNALSAMRFVGLIEAVDADFVLLPGDDDLPLPNYVSTSLKLARKSPAVTLISGGMGQIDAQGRRLATTNAAPVLEGAPIALGTLLRSASYNMPATGFRKSAIDVKCAPRTRTAFDWWLWIQCWLKGSAAVTHDETILYRQHIGQEQRRYGAQAFRNDAGRMLIDFVTSDAFQVVVKSWSPWELDQFVDTVLASDGPNSGDSRWGPMVQMVLVDRLAGSAQDKQLASLFAQASGHAGTPATLGAIRALAPELELHCLPVETWSRIPVSMEWQGDCALLSSWRRYLNVSKTPTPQFGVVFACACQGNPQALHRVTSTGERFDSGEGFCLTFESEPGEAETSRLLDSIGRLTGRLHGFETHVNDEAVVLAAYRRLRLSRPGVVLEKAYRWRGRRA